MLKLAFCKRSPAESGGVRWSPVKLNWLIMHNRKMLEEVRQLNIPLFQTAIMSKEKGKGNLSLSFSEHSISIPENQLFSISLFIKVYIYQIISSISLRDRQEHCVVSVAKAVSGR